METIYFDVKEDKTKDFADFTITSSNNDFEIVNDQNYFSQRIKQVLTAFNGEWFLDRNSGIPYFKNILNDPKDVQNLIIYLKDEIQRLDFVERILEINGIEVEENTLTIGNITVVLTNNSILNVTDTLIYGT